METKLKLLLIAALTLPFFAVAPVFAQEETAPDEPVSSQGTDRGQSKTREQRIADRKDKLEQRLTQFQQNVVRTRCNAANGLIKASQSRMNSFVAKRTQVYSGLVTRLEGLSPKLQAAGVDTATYDEQVGVLKSKADAYGTAIDDLKAAVDDLVSMDCQADPEGFVATLQEAIRLREDVISKGKDFRTYLKDTFKGTFADIRAQLQAKRVGSEEQ